MNTESIIGFAIALGVGMLIGLERERSKAAHGAPAGIRTFALLSLSGAVAYAVAGPLGLAVSAGFVTVLGALTYARSETPDPGLTTVSSMFAATLLGAYAMTEPLVSAGLAVVVTVLLAQHSAIHSFARTYLTSQELADGLILLVIGLVVLPLLPTAPFGPDGALNLRLVGILVALVLLIGAAGHIATRMAGARLGLPLAGFISGFVSAVAAIAAMGSRARHRPRLMRECLAAGVLANAATLVGVAVLVGITDPRLLRALALPLGLSFAAAGLYALVFALLGMRRGRGEAEDSPGRAFDLKTALVFAAVVAGSLALSAWLEERLGEAGVAAGIALAGFANSQSAAVSAAALSAAGTITPQAAVMPVLLALTAAVITRAVVSYVAGGRRYAARIVPGLALMVAATWAGFALV